MQVIQIYSDPDAGSVLLLLLLHGEIGGEVVGFLTAAAAAKNQPASPPLHTYTHTHTHTHTHAHVAVGITASSLM